MVRWVGGVGWGKGWFVSDNYIEPLLNAGCHSGPQAATAHVAPNRAQLLRAAWCISIQCTSAHYTDGACTTLQEKVFKQSTKLLGRHVYCTHQVYHHVQYKQCATLRGYEPAAPIGAADNKRPGHIGCTKQANLAPSKLHQAPGQSACTRWVAGAPGRLASDEGPRFSDKGQIPGQKVYTRKARVAWTPIWCDLHDSRTGMVSKELLSKCPIHHFNQIVCCTLVPCQFKTCIRSVNSIQL